ncbi:hypothetical protein JK358_01005 [Nocardia sp. 2]|uniref:Uncharacterized protein n=1 Tax=Nocardia acididurans TaxID=2802282 RepID=A0ABS1M1G6_9NOCA|nr:hypothetical protein [Nocardia acididurans]MBL1072968.1 hypothetical protein [Nocardia acididurans]
MIGDDAAFRLLHGRGTLCDVVLASRALGVDTVQAVLEYAQAILGGGVDGTVGEGEAGSRCA